MNGLLEMLGLAPSEQDRKLKKMISHTYESVRVVGRGTVKIDPSEVRNSEEFKQAKRHAKYIVKR